MRLNTKLQGYPVTFIKKENGAEMVIGSKTMRISPAGASNIPFEDEKVEGFVSVHVICDVQYSKGNNFNVKKETLEISDFFFELGGDRIDADTILDLEFYQMDRQDGLFSSITEAVDSQLAAKIIEVTDRDGSPWTEEEALAALEIYFKTLGMETKEEKEVIQQYIDQGKIHRGYSAIRMMIHGYRSLDKNNETHEGLQNMGKVFKETWEEHKDSFRSKSQEL